MTEPRSQRRVRVTYIGRVQGVGFRASTHILASRYPVVGYVRNCLDGSVEIEAEGSSEVVTELLDAIREHFAKNIRDTTVVDIPIVSAEASFEIRY